jgi:hypothetical protein
VTSQMRGPVISVMLAVDDTQAAVEWYKHALGATELCSLGSVAGIVSVSCEKRFQPLGGEQWLRIHLKVVIYIFILCASRPIV